jgi:hypothetical protein
MFDGNYIIFKPRKMAGSMLIYWRVYRLYGIEGRTKLDGLLPYPVILNSFGRLV